MFFQFFLDKHKQEADEQKDTGNPDSFCAVYGNQKTAYSRTNGEHQNNSQITDRFVKDLSVMGLTVGTKGFHAAADISNTHGTCKGVSIYLTEGLNLHGAGEGYDGVRENIAVCRDKSDGEKKQDLNQKDKLSPVNFLGHSVLDMYFLGYGNADSKGEERDQIMDSESPVAGCDALAEKNDIAGLGVGEYLSAKQVGIGILQAAG